MNNIFYTNIYKISNIKLSLFIFSVTFLLKFFYLLNTNGLERVPIQDAAAYFNLGKEIYENGLFTKEFLAGRPPLLPILTAIFFNFFSNENILTALRVIIILITSTIPISFYYISLNLKIDKKFAFLTALVIAFYPPSIYYSSFLLTENLASLFVSIILLLISKLIKSENKIKIIILLGLVFALLTLSRSIFILLPFFLIFFLSIYFYYFRIKYKNFFKLIFTLLFSYVIFLMPWSLLNKIKHDELIITTNRLGYMLYLTNSDLTDKNVQEGQYIKSEKFKKNLNHARQNFNYKTESNYLSNLAFEEIKQNYELLPSILFNRLVNTLNFRPNPYKSSITTNDLVMIFWVFFLASFIKYTFGRNLDFMDYFMLVIICYVLLTMLPFWGTPRFRYPIDNLLIFMSIKYYLNTKKYI